MCPPKPWHSCSRTERRWLCCHRNLPDTSCWQQSTWRKLPGKETVLLLGGWVGGWEGNTHVVHRQAVVLDAPAIYLSSMHLSLQLRWESVGLWDYSITLDTGWTWMIFWRKVGYGPSLGCCINNIDNWEHWLKSYLLLLDSGRTSLKQPLLPLVHL